MHFTRYLLYLHVCCESCIWPSFLVFLSVSYVITFMTMIPVIICNILWCHQSIGCLPCTWPRAHWCPSRHAPDAWRGCGSMSVEASSARRGAPMSRCNAVSITIYVGWDTCIFLYLYLKEFMKRIQKKFEIPGWIICLGIWEEFIKSKKVMEKLKRSI